MLVSMTMEHIELEKRVKGLSSLLLEDELKWIYSIYR